jgi:hypothetical protein
VELTFTPADDTLFNDFSFRGQLAASGFDMTVYVVVTNELGEASSDITFTTDKGANADFSRIGVTSPDQTIKSVEVFASGGDCTLCMGTGNFKEFKQVEFSFAGVPPGIPEPSTWAMMLVGFAGLGYAGYRKTKTNAALSI